MATAREIVDVSETGPSDVQIELGPESSLRGTVRDGSGTPIGSGAIVTAIIDTPVQRSFAAYTNEFGAFEFTGIPAGILHLVVRDGVHMPRVLDVEIGSSAAVIRDITLSESSNSVSGQVMRAGSPLAGALVFAHDAYELVVAQTTSSADGTYTLPTLPDGDLTISATSAGFAPSVPVPVTVNQGSAIANVDLELAAVGVQAVVPSAASTPSTDALGVVAAAEAQPAWLSQRDVLWNQAKAAFTLIPTKEQLELSILLGNIDPKCVEKFGEDARDGITRVGRRLFALDNAHSQLTRQLGAFASVRAGLKSGGRKLESLALEFSEVVDLLDRYLAVDSLTPILKTDEIVKFRNLFPNAGLPATSPTSSEIIGALRSAVELMQQNATDLADRLAGGQFRDINRGLDIVRMRNEFLQSLYARWGDQLLRFRSASLSEHEADFFRVQNLITSGGSGPKALAEFLQVLNNPDLESLSDAVREFDRARLDYFRAHYEALKSLVALVNCEPKPEAIPNPNPPNPCTGAGSNPPAPLPRVAESELMLPSGGGAMFSLLPVCVDPSSQTNGPVIRTSFDPNDKIGPGGFGAEAFTQERLLPYEIQFENDPDLGATIPAQEVFVTDVLDDDLDLTTVEFGTFGFNNFEFDVPAGLSHYETTIDLRPDGIDLLVPVVLDVDVDSRILSATFRSLDPLTGLLPDEVDAGFLPVNDKQLHNGEGFFTYRVQPLPTATTGTEIRNQASIVFDVNDPILTPVTIHTIDQGSPASTVSALPEAFGTANFTVRWSGQDESGGSGIAGYDIFVSRDGGPFEPMLTGTTQTSHEFTGESGSTYAFLSIARDNVGHSEAMPLVADTQTLVIIGAWVNRDNIYDVDARNGVTALDALIIINEMGRNSVSDPETFVLTPLPPQGFAPPFYDVTQDGKVTALDALRVINELARIFLGAGESIAQANPATLRPMAAMLQRASARPFTSGASDAVVHEAAEKGLLPDFDSPAAPAAAQRFADRDRWSPTSTPGIRSTSRITSSTRRSALLPAMLPDNGRCFIKQADPLFLVAVVQDLANPQAKLVADFDRFAGGNRFAARLEGQWLIAV